MKLKSLLIISAAILLMSTLLLLNIESGNSKGVSIDETPRPEESENTVSEKQVQENDDCDCPDKGRFDLELIASDAMIINEGGNIFAIAQNGSEHTLICPKIKFQINNLNDEVQQINVWSRAINDKIAPGEYAMWRLHVDYLNPDQWDGSYQVLETPAACFDEEKMAEDRYQREFTNIPVSDHWFDDENYLHFEYLEPAEMLTFSDQLVHEWLLGVELQDGSFIVVSDPKPVGHGCTRADREADQPCEFIINLYADEAFQSLDPVIEDIKTLYWQITYRSLE